MNLSQDDDRDSAEHFVASLRTFHGKFICMSDAGRVYLSEDSTRHEGKFRVTRYSDGTVSLASRCNEMYLSSADFGAIQGRREGCVWSVVCVPGDNQNGYGATNENWWLKSHSGQYIGEDVVRGRLVCNRSAPSHFNALELLLA